MIQTTYLWVSCTKERTDNQYLIQNCRNKQPTQVEVAFFSPVKMYKHFLPIKKNVETHTLIWGKDKALPVTHC